MKKKIILKIASVILIFSILSVIFLGICGAYAYNTIDFTLDERLFNASYSSSSTVYLAYSDSGELTEVWSDSAFGRKNWRELSEMGEYIKMGFISAEDRAFYNHHGFNLRRMAMAGIKYIVSKVKGDNRSFGASTITQQLIKNISGDNEYSLKRKYSEIVRAYHLEMYHTKDEILEMYLNIVPMSDNMSGVCAASMVYFGKEPCQLTLAEAATIVGITNSPAKYNPGKNPEACLNKRNAVLFAMYDNGAISKEEMQLARAEPLNVIKSNAKEGNVASWFIETAKEDIISDLMKKYNISRASANLMLLSDTEVILTMDRDLQRILEDVFENEENISDGFKSGLNYSFVLTDAKSGNLLGIIGGAGKKKSEKIINLANSKRTPGSILKPISLYAPLINEGKINWASVFDDYPTEYIKNGDELRAYPKNSPDIYDGLITVKDALRLSKNTVAIRLYEMLGKEKIFNMLKNDYGFDSLIERKVLESGKVLTDLDRAPLALGQLTEGVSLRKLTEAYSVFTGLGNLKKMRSYYAVIERGTGKRLLENKEVSRNIFSPQTANIMNQMLSEVVKDGTARNILLKNYVDTAGKTGTSGGDFDRWFIGYTPYFIAGIWSGYPSENKRIGIQSKSHLAIWDEVMQRVHREKIFSKHEDGLEVFQTDNLKIVEYCRDSGQLPTSACEIDQRANRVEFGYFTEDNMPKSECQRHITVIARDKNGEIITSKVKYEAPIDENINREDEDYLFNEKNDIPFILDEKNELEKRKKRSITDWLFGLYK